MRRTVPVFLIAALACALVVVPAGAESRSLKYVGGYRDYALLGHYPESYCDRDLTEFGSPAAVCFTDIPDGTAHIAIRDDFGVPAGGYLAFLRPSFGDAVFTQYICKEAWMPEWTGVTKLEVWIEIESPRRCATNEAGRRSLATKGRVDLTVF